MKYTIKNNKVIIRKNKYKAEIPLMNLNQLLQDPILYILDFSELINLFQHLYGIPYNIKEFLKKKIELYDTSSEVNGFYINGIDFWLDKNTRVGLAHLANCTEGVMQLVLGDTVLEIESSVMKEMLVQLERYAAQCYLQTQKHLIAIKELKTVEDIINYDYTKGYPEKLTFTV